MPPLDTPEGARWVLDFISKLAVREAAVVRARPNMVVVAESPPYVQLTIIAGSERVAKFSVTALEANHLVAQLQLAVARCTAIRHADREPMAKSALR